MIPEHVFISPSSCRAKRTFAENRPGRHFRRSYFEMSRGGLPVWFRLTTLILMNLTAPTPGKHTRQLRALETKKAHHGQRKYGRAGEDSPPPGNAVDELLPFRSPGDQLAHLDEVPGCEILRAKTAEGCD